jgi:hypothetical protein
LAKFSPKKREFVIKYSFSKYFSQSGVNLSFKKFILVRRSVAMLCIHTPYYHIHYRVLIGFRVYESFLDRLTLCNGKTGIGLQG